MNTEKNKEIWVNKVIDTLRVGKRSEKTILNYVSALKRFLNYYDDKTKISTLKEEDILEYFKKQYIQKNRAGDTYNMSMCAIKYMYSICFNKEFNKRLLPNIKLRKKIPTIIEKDLFIKIFNEEKNLKHKCWLLLSFCSGLRVDEVATVKIENIKSKEHKLKVLGKRNKERFTILPNITIKHLRLYYKTKKLTETSGYLFKGTDNKTCMNSKTIINYFCNIKRRYNLDMNLSFHSLRHSFATYYLMNGGDLLTLKSMLGHSSLTSTSIYIHLSQDFNNIKGIKYD